MKRTLILSLLFLSCTITYSQNCACDSLFFQTQKIVEDNYAGWFDKVTVNNKNAYTSWTNNQYLKVQNIKDDSTCAKVLQEWISFFTDKHLRIRYNKPKVYTNKVEKNKTIDILTTYLTESEIKSYISTTKNIDPIEGIYESSSYTLGITQAKENLYYATILATANENWKVGEVKLVIQKMGDTYTGSFYEGDKSDISTHEVKVVHNILDFDIIFFEKKFPEPQVKLDLTEYEMSKDRYAPSLKINTDVAIWKFPSFENNSYEQTQFLLKKYKKELESIPYWIVDLSNNTGGDYSIGMQVIEYIYSKPIQIYNAEMRMTETNFTKWYQYIADYYEQADSLTKSKLDERLNKMKASYGKMFNNDGTLFDTLKIDKVKPFPKKVALLINQNTVSSGEFFTLAARQSDKVVVMGTNSGGMIDYGNIVNYATTCSTIRVQLPTNRNLWLDTGFSVDKEGIKPDIYLQGDNWEDQAIQFIKK
ncbi:S41 family peptidase [Arundinibacter roseus]|uniref:Tail specific protease domain-containing protein n=1 Tax=Arundinibacter roseus TaxID=2070510 RepID=A0A4R4KIL2_9BACT|nr:S41 family peptidase [Arundinibacter roseus]TDB68044.1 hypothetical protein EZE20_03725 [Arundinibacter roseus]